MERPESGRELFPKRPHQKKAVFKAPHISPGQRGQGVRHTKHLEECLWIHCPWEEKKTVETVSWNFSLSTHSWNRWHNSKVYVDNRSMYVCTLLKWFCVMWFHSLAHICYQWHSIYFNCKESDPSANTDCPSAKVRRCMTRVEKARLEAMQSFGGGGLGDVLIGAKWRVACTLESKAKGEQGEQKTEGLEHGKENKDITAAWGRKKKLSCVCKPYFTTPTHLICVQSSLLCSADPCFAKSTDLYCEAV